MINAQPKGRGSVRVKDGNTPLLCHIYCTDDEIADAAGYALARGLHPSSVSTVKICQPEGGCYRNASV